MKYKILLRFDDICPTMNWEQWENAVSILDSIEATALLGVIPDNHDRALLLNNPRSDFWEYIINLQKRGYTIAMHGYQHVFDIQSSGLSTPKKQSEFAGHSFEEQNRRIKEGKRIMNEHGIDTDIFFAPAHSYDDNTLKALSLNGFRYISDGKSLKPYKRNGIVCYPELTGGLPNLNNFGKYFTAVFHTHEWGYKNHEGLFEKYKIFCLAHRDDIVSFENYKRQPLGWATIQRGSEILYKGISEFKHLLF